MSAHPATGRRRRNEESGETLLELLVTISIISVAFVSILAGIGTTLRFTRSDRNIANANAALTVATETVKAAAPSSCAALTTATYRAALDTTLAGLPTSWTVSNVTITAATCDDTSALKLQTITIKATAPGATAGESIDIVKRSL
jgi:type II secretory pathway pseudopilin PulG